MVARFSSRHKPTIASYSAATPFGLDLSANATFKPSSAQAQEAPRTRKERAVNLFKRAAKEIRQNPARAAVRLFESREEAAWGPGTSMSGDSQGQHRGYDKIPGALTQVVEVEATQSPYRFNAANVKKFAKTAVSFDCIDFSNGRIGKYTLPAGHVNLTKKIAARLNLTDLCRIVDANVFNADELAAIFNVINPNVLQAYSRHLLGIVLKCTNISTQDAALSVGNFWDIPREENKDAHDVNVPIPIAKPAPPAAPSAVLPVDPTGLDISAVSKAIEAFAKDRPLDVVDAYKQGIDAALDEASRARATVSTPEFDGFGEFAKLTGPDGKTKSLKKLREERIDRRAKYDTALSADQQAADAWIEAEALEGARADRIVVDEIQPALKLAHEKYMDDKASAADKKRAKNQIEALMKSMIRAYFGIGETELDDLAQTFTGWLLNTDLEAYYADGTVRKLFDKKASNTKYYYRFIANLLRQIRDVNPAARNPELALKTLKAFVASIQNPTQTNSILINIAGNFGGINPFETFKGDELGMFVLALQQEAAKDKAKREYEKSDKTSTLGDHFKNYPLGLVNYALFADLFKDSLTPAEKQDSKNEKIVKTQKERLSLLVDIFDDAKTYLTSAQKQEMSFIPNFDMNKVDAAEFFVAHPHEARRFFDEAEEIVSQTIIDKASKFSQHAAVGAAYFEHAAAQLVLAQRMEYLAGGRLITNLQKAKTRLEEVDDPNDLPYNWSDKTDWTGAQLREILDKSEDSFDLLRAQLLKSVDDVNKWQAFLDKDTWVKPPLPGKISAPRLAWPLPPILSDSDQASRTLGRKLRDRVVTWREPSLPKVTKPAVLERYKYLGDNSDVVYRRLRNARVENPENLTSAQLEELIRKNLAGAHSTKFFADFGDFTQDLKKVFDKNTTGGKISQERLTYGQKEAIEKAMLKKQLGLSDKQEVDFSDLAKLHGQIKESPSLVRAKAQLPVVEFHKDGNKDGNNGDLIIHRTAQEQRLLNGGDVHQITEARAAKIDAFGANKGVWRRVVMIGLFNLWNVTNELKRNGDKVDFVFNPLDKKEDLKKLLKDNYGLSNEQIALIDPFVEEAVLSDPLDSLPELAQQYGVRLKASGRVTLAQDFLARSAGTEFAARASVRFNAGWTASFDPLSVARAVGVSPVGLKLSGEVSKEYFVQDNNNTDGRELQMDKGYKVGIKGKGDIAAGISASVSGKGTATWAPTGFCIGFNTGKASDQAVRNFTHEIFTRGYYDPARRYDRPLAPVDFARSERRAVSFSVDGSAGVGYSVGGLSATMGSAVTNTRSYQHTTFRSGQREILRRRDVNKTEYSTQASASLSLQDQDQSFARGRGLIHYSSRVRNKEYWAPVAHKKDRLIRWEEFARVENNPENLVDVESDDFKALVLANKDVAAFYNALVSTEPKDGKVRPGDLMIVLDGYTELLRRQYNSLLIRKNKLDPDSREYKAIENYLLHFKENAGKSLQRFVVSLADQSSYTDSHSWGGSLFGLALRYFKQSEEAQLNRHLVQYDARPTDAFYLDTVNRDVLTNARKARRLTKA